MASSNANFDADFDALCQFGISFTGHLFHNATTTEQQLIDTRYAIPEVGGPYVPIQSNREISEGGSVVDTVKVTNVQWPSYAAYGPVEVESENMTMLRELTTPGSIVFRDYAAMDRDWAALMNMPVVVYELSTWDLTPKITALPAELRNILFGYLDECSSLCLGLTSRHWYKQHRLFYPHPISFQSFSIYLPLGWSIPRGEAVRSKRLEILLAKWLFDVGTRQAARRDNHWDRTVRTAVAQMNFQRRISEDDHPLVIRPWNWQEDDFE